MSEMNSPQLPIRFLSASIPGMCVPRTGEDKLGSFVEVLPETVSDWEGFIRKSSCLFVLLAIPEDIGVRANFGIGGTRDFWEPVCKALMNVQQTDTLKGETLLILGALDCSDLLQESAGASVSGLRDLVARLDRRVAPVIRTIVSAGKIPLVLGGGHNNAYPLLKGASEALKLPLNCLNLDAHSDYRVIEGRHSGNGFRYAKTEGFLQRYAMLGLHRNYNSQQVLTVLEQDASLLPLFFEDIFLYDRMSYQEALGRAITFVAGTSVGIELDMDAIEHALSSASTPVGLTVLQARRYVVQAVKKLNPVYFHLTEGAVALSNGRTDPATAKTAVYLLTDFMRTRNMYSSY